MTRLTALLSLTQSHNFRLFITTSGLSDAPGPPHFSTRSLLCPHSSCRRNVLTLLQLYQLKVMDSFSLYSTPVSGVDPYGTRTGGGTRPQYLNWRDIITNVHQYVRSRLIVVLTFYGLTVKCRFRFRQSILRKIINVVASRCHILRLKCRKFGFG